MECSIVARDVQILKGEQCNKMALINLLLLCIALIGLIVI